jgi:hypothetical protein
LQEVVRLRCIKAFEPDGQQTLQDAITVLILIRPMPHRKQNGKLDYVNQEDKPILDQARILDPKQAETLLGPGSRMNRIRDDMRAEDTRKK